MSEKKSQKDRVLDRIAEVGYVDNFWAIENYILRLGAIICDLTKEGMEFKRAFGKELNKEKQFHKNFYYILVKSEPEQQSLL